MQTIYDWLSVLLFGAIALTYLQRSLKAPSFPDKAINYLPPTVGCALSNWLGNEGHSIAAIVTLIVSAAWFVHFIHPLRR